MAVSSAAIDLIALVWEFPPMDPMLATLCGGALLGLGLGLLTLWCVLSFSGVTTFIYSNF